MRTDIEDRIQEAKLGAGLIHLPSGYVETNTVWMWAALLAGNLSTLLQAITGIDTGKQGRAHGDRLRQQLRSRCRLMRRRPRWRHSSIPRAHSRCAPDWLVGGAHEQHPVPVGEVVDRGVAGHHATAASSEEVSPNAASTRRAAATTCSPDSRTLFTSPPDHPAT